MIGEHLAELPLAQPNVSSDISDRRACAGWAKLVQCNLYRDVTFSRATQAASEDFFHDLKSEPRRKSVAQTFPKLISWPTPEVREVSMCIRQFARESAEKWKRATRLEVHPQHGLVLHCVHDKHARISSRQNRP